MALSLRQRLLQADEAFLLALDTLELQDFQEDWDKLAGDIVEATNAGRISEEDLSLARLVSARVTILSESFSEFTQECDTISLSFEQDLESIVERHRSNRRRSLSHLSDCAPGTSAAPYIKQAYTWLMNNIFNPYPSKRTRETIARDAGCDSRHVENWFADIRKRIGWNAIRKRHFSNKRSLTIAAATAFFQEKENNILNDATRLAFATMLQQAEALYSGRFIVSELVRSIAGGKSCKKSGRDTTPSDSGATIFSVHSFSSYPSPLADRVEEGHSSSSIDGSESPLTVRKRKRCDSIDRNASPPTQNVRKRVRKNSVHEIPEPEVTNRISLSLPKRHRRVSDSQDQSLTKHPSTRSQLAQQPVVSDPLPLRTPSASPDSLSSGLTANVPTSVANVFDGISNPISHPIATDSAQQLSSLHSLPPTDLSLPDGRPLLAQDIQKDTLRFSFEPPESVSCDQPVDTQSVFLTLYDPSLSQGPSTPVDNNLSASYLDPNPHAMPFFDVDVPPWTSLLNDHSTNDQVFGLFGSLPHNPISVSSVGSNLLPALGGVDLGFNQFFDLDCGAPYPLPEPQIDNLFSVDLIEGVNMNDMLSLAACTTDNTRAKVFQLEQLRKRRNRIQEHIASLETQLAATLSA